MRDKRSCNEKLSNDYSGIQMGQIDDFMPTSFLDTFWSDFSKKAAEKRIPIHGHFELTPRCNFDCKMCYIHLEPKQMTRNEMPLSDWIHIIDEAIDAGMVFASLSGGECLLVPYFDELYLYLKKRGILVFILTNGYLLKEKLSFFVKHPPAHIQVSVYGWDDDSYQKVTGKRSYTKVIDGIIAAKDLGLSISVAITASRYLPSVYNIVKYFYELNIGATVNRWLMPPYESTGRYLENINLSPNEQANVELELFKATNQPINAPYDGPLPPVGSHNTIHHYGLSCSAGRTDFSINWKGEMSPCVSLPDPTGYPLKEKFVEAWERTVLFADNFELPIECFECEYKSICKHCPAFHLLSGKKGHCNVTACEACKIMVSKGLRRLNP